MSGYRGYVPWTKSPPSSSSYSTPSSTKKDSTSTSSKYDSTFAKKKPEDDKSATTRIANKYGAYGSGYQRDAAASGSYSNRLKPALEKKESHPPVSYRSLARTTPRSRDPSPDKSSSSSYNYNKLYPTRPYARSTSRELDIPTTIPKYTGRTSVNKDEGTSRRSSLSREDLTVPSRYGGRSSTTKDDVVSRYTGRSSITKDEVQKYGGRSSLNKDDLVPKYGGRSSTTKEDLLKYKSTSRAPSREDLSSSSSSQKYINSRFLPKNTIEKSHTAYTRPSSIRSNETIRKNRELLNVLHAQQEQERASRPPSRCSSITPDDHGVKTPAPKDEAVEMETVATITRGTSPSPTTSNIARARRTELAKTVEKQITRPKLRIGIDKEVQSDRMDDTTKNSRFSGASRMTATPWSSFLDMKFSGPKETSPKVSRNNSSKSLSEKKSPPKSKTSPPKQSLPPQIPKSDSTKSTSLHSITTNKDFRKSVLNMSTEGGKKKVGRRSNSASSAESETDVQASEATDVSENLTSCTSYHKSSSSKLPQRVEKGAQRSRRSPSSDASTSSSSASEEEKREVKATASRTSLAVSSADEVPKPPPSPRVKSEAEAKSFLMRALAPVTNLFKAAPKDNSDRVNWMDSSPSESAPNTPSEKKPGKFFKKVESGERAWWLDDTSISGSLPLDSEKSQKKLLRHVQSGELPWWLDKSAEVPEGVETFPDETKIKIFRLESGDTTDSGQNIMDPEYQERHKIRHIDSGERSWWLTSSENIPEMVEAQETKTQKAKYAIRHQESGEKAWWLKSNSHSEEFDAPLGDRASPEGLEMPKENEGRLSPYDNVPVESKRKVKKVEKLFISKHSDIDEILGGCGQMWSPLMERIFEYQDKGEDNCQEVDAKEVRIHDSTAQRGVIQPARIDNIGFPKTFSPYGKVSNLLFNDLSPFAF